MDSIIKCLGGTPACLHTILPSLNNNKVGTLLIPYLVETSLFLSTSIFKTLAPSPIYGVI